MCRVKICSLGLGRWLAAASSIVACLLCCSLLFAQGGDTPPTADRLNQGFVNPPPSARPAGYWAWLNGHADPSRFAWELGQWKAKGMSKAYIFECGARDPQGIVPAGPAFMSEASIATIVRAIREAGRVGIELGLTTSSSWNAGGSWVPPQQASMGLFQSQTQVTGPARFSEVLPFPEVPAKAPKRDDGRPVFRQEVAVLAVPQAETTAKPAGQNAKAAMVIDDVESIVDLSDRIDADGRLTWDVPPGNWTVMRLICSNTGQGLAIPSPNSQGLAIDHFSAEATRAHFEFFIDELEKRVGPLKDTALTTLYLCSYELRGAAWTPGFLEEFQRRRGYDMKKYLPVLFGAEFNNQEVGRRFDYDYRKTQGDLLVDAFYGTAAEVCHEHGLLLCAEAGGPGPPTHNVPVDALKAQGVIDIPRGEFWTDLHLQVVKETACASHVYGKRIVDMESFTSWAHWQHGPFDLKPFADRAMCEGTNHFTFHTSPHRPADAGLPGWAYHAGTHIAPSIAWWPKAGALIDYLARCCFLLQQGHFVGDVCYYYGDRAYNFVPPKQVDPSLGPGYDYDVTNAEVILERMSVEQGRITLPDGMKYEILVLPDREDINPDVLRKLDELVRAGATIVGPKPSRSGGLYDYRRRDQQVRQLAERIWGPCDGKTVLHRDYGDGRVVWGQSLRDVLHSRGVGPDFTFRGRDEKTDLDYLHRRTADADIYFVRNRSTRWEEVDCVFRVKSKRPELWMPTTGRIHIGGVYREVDAGTEVPLRLPPSGSLFVVFRQEADRDHVVAVHRSETPAPLPRPAVLPGIELFDDNDGPDGLRALATQPGRYTLRTARGRDITIEVPAVEAARTIAGPWSVRFPAGWGAPPETTFDRLISWTEHPEPGVKYFSGMAEYETRFDLDPQRPAADVRLFLDLGLVEEIAEVWLNGRPLGVVWNPPYVLDATDAVQPGRNRLTVQVANTWSNRLAGDALSPDGPKYCRTNIAGSIAWKVPWKETPLLRCGLLGPVRLIPAKEIPIELR